MTYSIEHTVDTAIDESKANHSTVHIDWSEAAETRLAEECDGYNGLEFWGADIDGVTWRVVLDTEH